MERAELESKYGKVWNTAELKKDFDVIGFSMGFVVVRNKETGEKGSFDFQHQPRFYYGYIKA